VQLHDLPRAQKIEFGSVDAEITWMEVGVRIKDALFAKKQPNESRGVALHVFFAHVRLT